MTMVEDGGAWYNTLKIEDQLSGTSMKIKKPPLDPVIVLGPIPEASPKSGPNFLTWNLPGSYVVMRVAQGPFNLFSPEGKNLGSYTTLEEANRRSIQNIEWTKQAQSKALDDVLSKKEELLEDLRSRMTPETYGNW